MKNRANTDLGEIYDDGDSNEYTNYEQNHIEEEAQDMNEEHSYLQGNQDRSSKPRFANNSNTIKHNFVRDSTLVDEAKKADLTGSMSVEKNVSGQSKQKSLRSAPKMGKSNDVLEKQKWSFEKNSSGAGNGYTDSKYQQQTHWGYQIKETSDDV